MVLDMLNYSNKIKNLDIKIMYSGPMWDDGVKGLTGMVKVKLEGDNIPGSAAKSVFSVFVEQVTNMLMYSAEKERFSQTDKEPVDISTGMLLMGQKDKTYFTQTGNFIKNDSARLVKERIDHLNSLDKKQLRQYYREKMREENENPESKGGGLGLIEIAKRATAPISYTIEPVSEGFSYFSMYVEISQEGV